MNETLAAPPPAKTFKFLPARADLIMNGEIVLPLIWKQMHEEGIWEMFFHDFPELNFGAFVRVMSEPLEQVHAVCLMEGDAITDICAIAMLTDIRQTDLVKRALGNFLLFKNYWASADNTRIGALILDAWFSELETIAGVTPEKNIRALRFIEHMGFEKLGVVPGFSSYRGETCGSVVTHMTRRAWLQRREELFG